MTPDNHDDEFIEWTIEEQPDIYPENLFEFGRCLGLEGSYDCCKQDAAWGDYLCTRCRALECEHAAEARSQIEQARRRALGIFTEQEKEILKESLTEDERKDFDLKCSAAEFPEDARKLFRSTANFLLAEFKASTDLVDRAAEVVILRDGRFVTIRELVDECVARGSDYLLYEAWVSQTRQRVRDAVLDLDPTSARAMVVYAKGAGYYKEVRTSAD